MAKATPEDVKNRRDTLKEVKRFKNPRRDKMFEKKGEYPLYIVKRKNKRLGGEFRYFYDLESAKKWFSMCICGTWELCKIKWYEKT